MPNHTERAIIENPSKKNPAPAPHIVRSTPVKPICEYHRVSVNRLWKMPKAMASTMMAPTTLTPMMRRRR